LATPFSEEMVVHEQEASPPRAWLYRYEATGIQEYILTTERMREMAAASSLVEELGEVLEKALPGDAEVLMSAAGTATVRFTSEIAAQSFTERWPMLVARKVPGLALVQYRLGVERDDLSESIAPLHRGLEAARNEPFVDLPEAGPLLARAGRTGLPAVAFRKDEQKFYELRGLVDAATRAKLRRTDLKHEDERYGVDKRLALADGRRFVEELSELGEGYAAVVHTDGNGVGAFLTGARLNHESYREFSKGLGEVTLDAARAAVQALASREHAADLVRIRPLVLGGDDLTVVITAEHALAFVERFTSEFERRSREKLGRFRAEGFTASSGVAFVKIGFPFHQAYRLAEQLCLAAKNALRSEADATPSAVLFHRVTTATIAPWEVIRQEELSAIGADKAVNTGALSAGPWRIDPIHPHSLAALQKLVEAMAATPRGSLREWLRIARNDLRRATAHWERMMEVLRSTSRQAGNRRHEELTETLRELGVDAETGWEKGASRTPLLDALVWSNLSPGGDRLWREDA
jgi:hypothetical protein